LAIAVEDLDRSLNFSCELLGLTPVHPPRLRRSLKPKAKRGRGGAPTRGFALVHLAPPRPGVPTPFLSITDQPRGDHPKPEFWNWGLQHFGVWVKEHDAALARLEAAGVTFAAPSLESDSTTGLSPPAMRFAPSWCAIPMETWSNSTSSSESKHSLWVHLRTLVFLAFDGLPSPASAIALPVRKPVIVDAERAQIAESELETAPPDAVATNGGS
jgi:catechol 2,3-dioxygenase-like lactoylglutathione lyase family enzyme